MAKITENKTQDGGDARPLSIFAGGGEMGALLRQTDWSTSLLGDPSRWPAALHAALDICLTCAHPMAIYWGEARCLLYNDAWRPIAGDKHPKCLGQAGRVVWPELWGVIGPAFDDVFRTGEGRFFADQPLAMNRFGYDEETYFDYTLSPLRGTHGETLGVLNIVADATYRVLSERRNRLVHDVVARTKAAATPEEACSIAATVIAQHSADLPFALLYSTVDDPHQALLSGATGRVCGAADAPVQLQVDNGVLDPQTFPDAKVVSIGGNGGKSPLGFLVVGVSAKLPFDAAYQGFLELLAQGLENGIANTLEQRTLARVTQERAKLKVLSEAITHMAWRTDPYGKATYFNRRWAERTGATIEQCLGDGWLHLLHPDDKFLTLQLWAAANQTGGEYSVEHRLRMLDGSYRWHAARAVPIFDQDRKLAEWIGTSTDIEDQKRAQAAIQESEERYRVITDVSPLIIWEGRADGYIIFCNQWWYDYTGLTVAQSLGDGWVSAIHPDHRENVHKVWLEAATGGTTYEVEIPFRRGSDGAYRWHLARGLAVKNEYGDVTRWVGSALDIHERKEAGDAIRQTQERYESVAQATDFGVWYCDLPFDELMWDARVRKHFFVAPNAVVTINDFYARIHPDDRERTRLCIARSIEEHSVYDIELRTVDPQTGQIRWIKAKGRTSYDAAGEPCEFDGITIDITARKTTEEALRESELRFRLLADNISQLAWMSASDGTIFWYNQRWYEYTGTDEQLMKTVGWHTVHHPDYVERVVTFVNDAWKKGEEWELTFPVRRYDGEWRWFLTRAVPIHDAAGRLVRWFGTNTDINDHKQATDRIENLQRVTAALARELNVLEVADILLRQGLETFGANAGVVLRSRPGEPYLDVLSTLNYSDELVAVWKTFTPQRALPVPESLRTGQALFLEARQTMLERFPELSNMIATTKTQAFVALPLKIEERTVAVVGFAFNKAKHFPAEVRDYMQLVVSQCAQALERAFLFGAEVARKEELEAAVRARDEFLSIASHELKTPVTSLKLQLQMTRRGVKPELNIAPSPEKLAKTLDLSTRQVDRLTALIEDLLDVSRVESGKMTYHFEPVDIGALVIEVLERFAEQLEAVRCTLHCTINGPVTVDCDRFRIEQVVTNFITNAIKYGAGSPVSVVVAASAAGGKIAVTDGGMGIAKEKQSLVFGRFERAISHNNISGLGLGLYITKQIVDAHGGTITLESELGQGSTFTVELPTCPPSSRG